MTSKGCVLIHGFTGSPKEIELLAKYLELKGYDISTPTLAGHGENIDRRLMARFDWQDWVESAENAVKEMVGKHGEIYLIGFSMGGMIAAYLATKYPVKKLVLLSASVIYTNPTRFLKDMRRNPITKTQLKRYIHKFRVTPINATINFRKLVSQLKPYLHDVEVPTLIIQGELDDIVDPESANYIYGTIKSKEKHLHFLPKSKHIVCWDCEKDHVFELVDSFFESNISILESRGKQ